ncbi:MAG: T9SS type A sorting domain-containing protein [Saprospiraceae bacterium]
MSIKHLLSILCLFFVPFNIGITQSCSPGDPSGLPGGGVTPPGIGWPFPVLNSYDPNDIVPPATVGEQGWVRRDQELPFMLRCENHPDSATAPVQEAWIYLPFHANVDVAGFQFGDIGFGDFFISVPEGLQSFSRTVNASASLGVKVVIEAGIESAQNRAYWHFQSLDPATNLPPADPFVGFLPVNDSITHRGEAFAHFSIRPKASTQTFDLLKTQASIIFDENPPIATPVLTNTIDADHPVSQILTPFSAPDNSHLRVKWSGTDKGCGLANYTIFVSTDSTAFVPWQVLTGATEALLPAVLGHHYRFVSVARDSVGNVEPVKAPTEVVFTPDLVGIFTPQTRGKAPFILFQNQPNPFGEFTIIDYELFEAGKVDLTVHNMLGVQVRRLFSGQQTLGRYRVNWDAADGVALSQGMYVIRLQVNGYSLEKKAILINGD